MLKKLVFTVSGLLLIYCLQPNKLEIIDSHSKECDINSLTRNNKCMSILDVYRENSINKRFNEDIYRNAPLHFK